MTAIIEVIYTKPSAVEVSTSSAASVDIIHQNSTKIELNMAIQGPKGDKGDAASLDIDPVLVFENALI